MTRASLLLATLAFTLPAFSLVDTATPRSNRRHAFDRLKALEGEWILRRASSARRAPWL
jgi:hypothetical protein